jgi:hypothetical protein
MNFDNVEMLQTEIKIIEEKIASGTLSEEELELEKRHLEMLTSRLAELENSL